MAGGEWQGGEWLGTVRRGKVGHEKAGGMKTQTFFVHDRLPDMNQMIAACKGMRGRGTLYALMKAEMTEWVRLAAREAKLQPVSGYVYFDFIWHEPNKRRDPDNFSGGGKKFILDGLVKAGILENDGWGQIHGFADHWQHDKAHPGVLVEIRCLGRPADELDLMQGPPR
jgi:hypothetical protein